jgi:hypothetical protein
MTYEQQRVEAIWTYEISKKKILKRLVEKGFISNQGRYGGTHAHPEIALAYKAWLFPEIMLEIVTRKS